MLLGSYLLFKMKETFTVDFIFLFSDFHQCFFLKVDVCSDAYSKTTKFITLAISLLFSQQLQLIILCCSKEFVFSSEKKDILMFSCNYRPKVDKLRWC